MSSEMRELVEALAGKWERIAAERGVVQFTGNDHLLFANELRALLARTEAGAVEKRAPVQRYHGKTIPWRVHGLAWEAYAKKYGSSQSAERIAERGGFGVGEMDEFLPGWREMAEGTRPQDASGDAERICDYLCEQEYDIGGRDELLAHIRAAMQAKEAK